MQQSEYSICANKKNGDWHYASHQQALLDTNDDDQELVWKINLPASLRLTVLKHLDQFNLNAYSLFGSEDTLVETVAMREVLFDPS